MAKGNVRSRAQKMTCDPVAARLLELLYMRFLVAMEAGRSATYQSYANLMDDTGFTFAQVKRGLRVLREKGLLQSEQHIQSGKNVGHHRLPELVLSALEGQPGMVLESQLGMVTEGQPGMALESQLLYTGTSTGTSAATSTSSASPSPSQPYPDENQKVSEEIEKMKMKEMLEKKSFSDKANKLLHKPMKADGPLALGLLWSKTLGEHYKSYVPPLTEKQRGQIGHIRKFCPPGKAAEVLVWAATHWTYFSNRVKSLENLIDYPAHPNIGFLLKHVGIASNLALPSPTTVKQEATPVLVAAEPVQVTAQGQPKLEKQSLAEIYADPDED